MTVGICIGVVFSGLFCLTSSVPLVSVPDDFQTLLLSPPILKRSIHDSGISSPQTLHTPKAYLSFINYSASPMVPLIYPCA